MLKHWVSAADIDRLVLTTGYGRFLTATGILTGSDTGITGVLSGLVSRRAVANARDKLVSLVVAELASGKPRSYRLAPAAPRLPRGTGSLAAPEAARSPRPAP